MSQGLGRLTWEYGVLGIICVLLIVALVWVVKRWQAAMQDKVDMAKGFASDLKESNDAQTNLIIETNRHNEALRIEVAGRKDNLVDLEKAVDELKTKQIEFIAAAAGRNNG